MTSKISVSSSCYFSDRRERRECRWFAGRAGRDRPTSRRCSGSSTKPRTGSRASTAARSISAGEARKTTAIIADPAALRTRKSQRCRNATADPQDLRGCGQRWSNPDKHVASPARLRQAAIRDAMALRKADGPEAVEVRHSRDGKAAYIGAMNQPFLDVRSRLRARLARPARRARHRARARDHAAARRAGAARARARRPRRRGRRGRGIPRSDRAAADARSGRADRHAEGGGAHRRRDRARARRSRSSATTTSTARPRRPCWRTSCAMPASSR